MMSVDQLARIAYEAHGRAAAGRTPAQPWAQLPTPQRAAWIAAVQAVRAEIAKH